ncbi:7750_t:CDS:2, partial [Gigaspora rosea]
YDENLFPSDDEFFITKNQVTKKTASTSKYLTADKDQIKINNNFPVLKERKINKIVAAKLGDIGNNNVSEYNDNDRPSKRTRSQRKK